MNFLDLLDQQGNGIGGSLGSTANAILRSSGTGGGTAQGSAATIDDDGNVVVPAAASYRWSGRGYLDHPVDGVTRFNSSTGGGATLSDSVIVGTLSTAGVRLKVDGSGYLAVRKGDDSAAASVTAYDLLFSNRLLDSTAGAALQFNGLLLGSSSDIKFTSGIITGPAVAGLKSPSAGVVQVTDGGSGSGSLRVADGSAAAPAITGADTDTGLYFPVAGQIGFAIGGTPRAILFDIGGRTIFSMANSQVELQNSGTIFLANNGTTNTFHHSTTWAAGLGVISHLVGPSDGTFVLRAASGWNTVIQDGSGTNRLAVSTGGITVQAGVLSVPNGSAAAPSYTFTNGGTTGFYYDGTLGNVGLSDAGTLMVLWRNAANAIRHKSTVQLTWSSGSPDAAVEDLGIARQAAGVARFTDGSAGLGSTVHEAVILGPIGSGQGSVRLARDSTNNRLAVRLYDDSAAAGTITDHVIIGSADTSGVRLDVSGGNLRVREGDNSGEGPQLSAAIINASTYYTGTQWIDSGGGLRVGSAANNAVSLGSNRQIGWSSDTNASSAHDTGLGRFAPSVARATNASTGFGHMLTGVYGIAQPSTKGATGIGSYGLFGTAMAVANDGSGVVALDAEGPYFPLTTNTTGGNSAYVGTANLVARYDSLPHLIGKVALEDTSDVRVWVAISDGGGATLSSATPNNTVGVRFDTGASDTALTFYCRDATTTQTEASSVTPVANTVYYVDVDYGASSVTLRILDADGAVLDSHTFSADLPTSTTEVGPIAGATTLTTASKVLRLYWYRMGLR